MKRLQKTQINNTHIPHGFASGMVIGAVFGAAAYFLYGTSKGDEFKNQFLAEYERAQAELPPSLLYSSDAGEKTHELDDAVVSSPVTTMGFWERIRGWFMASSSTADTSDREQIATSEKRRYFKRRNS